MAIPPFNPAETVPQDTDVASAYPLAERTFRDIIESWIVTEHGRSGHHALPLKTTAQRDAIVDWEAGSVVYNTTLSRFQIATSIGPVVWASAFNTSDTFPSGTRMPFQQTSAPTGWTKDVSASFDNAALTLSTGAVATGGSVDFETCFASQTPAGTVNPHTLTLAETPAHEHLLMNTDTPTDAAAPTASNQLAKQGQNTGSNTFNYQLMGSATAATIGKSSTAGGGGAHDHTFTGTAINLDAKFVDCIIGQKD